MKITMTVDDKQKMINVLQPALVEGEKFGKAMFDSLVNDWGADKYQIDQIGLIEMGTEHVIDCALRMVDLEFPSEFIKYNLAVRSDYELGKMGLTREQYEAVRYGERQMRLL